MADPDGQRVRGVIGERLGRQREQRLDHARHLVLGRAPAAADGALDLLRRVVEARDAARAGGGEHDAARLPDGERGAHVLAEVEGLHRDGLRRVLGEQRADARLEVVQAPLGRDAGGAS